MKSQKCLVTVQNEPLIAHNVIHNFGFSYSVQVGFKWFYSFLFSLWLGLARKKMTKMDFHEILPLDQFMSESKGF